MSHWQNLEITGGGNSSISSAYLCSIMINNSISVVSVVFVADSDTAAVGPPVIIFLA